MLPIAEALLLFALHDDKGTVAASAFMALDTTLRGGLLAELRLRGFVQTHVSGELRPHPNPPRPPAEPVLAAAWGVLSANADARPVADALTELERGIPDLRDALTAQLALRGILGEATIERMGLPDDVVYPMADESHEANLRAMVDHAVRVDGTQVSPRIGTLIGLAVAAHLEADLFSDVDAAMALADWVAERDGVLRAVREAVERVEGW
jgi:hypothetical protein